MLLKQYTIKNNIHKLDILIDQSLKEHFLSEDISDFHYDTMENRFFGDSVKISHKVFQQEFIKFRNSKKISISNSIIMCDLNFLSEDGPIDVCLDNCIILGKLRFFGSDFYDICISDCNISSILYYNSKITNCFISNCRVGTFYIEDSILNQLSFFCNVINDIEKYQSKITEFRSNGNTIDLKRIIKGEKPSSVDLLGFVNTPAEEIFESIKDPIETRIETIKFLKDANLLSQKRDIEQLADLELTCLSEKNRFNKWLVRCLSGFKKPSRFFILGIAIIVGFSIGYFKFGTLSIGNRNCISLLEAFYFSGVTFSTIGYGDIHPLGLTRIFAVVEGLLGIITCSGILVSIVNKYTKSN